MDACVTFTSSRTFGSNFVRVAQMWFAGAAGYVSILVIVGVFSAISYGSQPIWMGALGGAAWVAIMLPCFFALQAWTAVQASRKRGNPKFKFDRDGISCESGKLHTSAPWAGINRIRLTRRTCFVYLSPRCAWFFGRDELTPEDESQLFNFARAENVKFQGDEFK